ncbi:MULTISPECIES: TetR/AcrR family transcriptional regulator [Corynebacterium]|uniref:TetR/AcrR family transcriptional regulator n=1 Tax=Corynebacterium TaxID=1716 RepID=UPI00195A1169|nr:MULTISPECIES: TetR/AcrR family transcriptional regulator [Corynebacterium]MDN8625349.1 TetR/AcrR family transcriptional regulator [Corynebacterium kroppenstedtii]QRQ65034.1 TetR/AcrR family transcriptional regulator [Corynebacterium kroppenstedtii]
MTRQRMSAAERRSQLIAMSRPVFAEKGIEGTSVEELAARAGVSKPVIYEHFGGKEGLYQAVIDEDMVALDRTIDEALVQGRSRIRIERAVYAVLDFAEKNEEGFRILARDGAVVGAVGRSSQPKAASQYDNSATDHPSAEDGVHSTLLGLSVNRASHILADAFKRNGLDERLAELYAQGMMGCVAMVAQWWTVNSMGVGSENNVGSDKAGATESASDDNDDSDNKGNSDNKHVFPKDAVAAHIVNLMWNGLAGMEKDPILHEDVEGEASQQGVRLGAGKEADPAEVYRQQQRDAEQSSSSDSEGQASDEIDD